jgi:hypothetical protein
VIWRKKKHGFYVSARVCVHVDCTSVIAVIHPHDGIVRRAFAIFSRSREMTMYTIEIRWYHIRGRRRSWCFA